MSEIVIDITRSLGRLMQGRIPTGVDRVVLAYIEHYRARAQALVRFGGRWLAMGEADSARLFDILLAPEGNQRPTIRWIVGRAYALNQRETTSMPKMLFNLNHSGLDSPGYAAEIKRRRWDAFFFLHDLIPITYSEYSRAGEAEKHNRRLATMLSAGKGIILNSADTQKDLHAYAQQNGLTAPPSVAAHLAPAPMQAPADKRPMNAPYFVILGTIEARKNHLLLLHIWRELARELGDSAPRLVIIGQRGWECEQVVDMLERCEAIRGLVIEKSKCGNAELATWLRHAQALLFPSFAEGFGIPLVEAYALGVPCIVSDLPVFREIAADAPEYASPLDAVRWKNLILDYAWSDSIVRGAQCTRIKSFRMPTWKNHFSIVDAFLAPFEEREAA